MSNNLGDALRKAGIDVPKPEPRDRRGEAAGGAPRGQDERPRKDRTTEGRLPRAGAPRQEPAIPAECVFQSYYGEGGTLRREIFIEAAERVARLFNSREGNVRPFALRLFLNRVRAIDRDLRTKACTMDQVRERMYAVRRDAAYQVGRRTLGPVFVEFLTRNLEPALKDEREFHGFVEYFTSVAAYCRQKE
ncbi:MAG: type III-A CRISPR-associated protein Csm2 [Planctomycetota bacterium]|nr:type III-A CRISPR-associated protein Csm2 [Planctomycetota bacterium]